MDLPIQHSTQRHRQATRVAACAGAGHIHVREFHEVIQAAFGWDDSHLFGFIGKTNKDNFDISIPDDFLNKFSRQKTIDTSKTKLKSFFTDRAIQKMCYIYDFGDNWTHIITLEDVLEEQREKADCATGNGACPPSCPVNFARQ